MFKFIKKWFNKKPNNYSKIPKLIVSIEDSNIMVEVKLPKVNSEQESLLLVKDFAQLIFLLQSCKMAPTIVRALEIAGINNNMTNITRKISDLSIKLTADFYSQMNAISEQMNNDRIMLPSEVFSGDINDNGENNQG